VIRTSTDQPLLTLNPIKDDPYWTSRENSLEVRTDTIVRAISSINNVGSVLISSFSNTRSISNKG
jgi:hypothetical protein